MRDQAKHPHDRVSTERLIELLEECADDLTGVSDGGQIIIGRGEDREYTNWTCGGIALGLREAARRLRTENAA